MKSADQKGIMELVGVVAIVGSLVFVGQQLRLDRTIAQSENSLQYVDTQVSLSQLITENAQIWLAGLKGEELSDLDALIFNQVAYAVEQKYASRYARSKSGLRSSSADKTAEQFAQNLYTHPGLRRYVLDKWRVESEIYDSSLEVHDAVRNYLDKIDKGEIDPVPTSSWGH